MKQRLLLCFLLLFPLCLSSCLSAAPETLSITCYKIGKADAFFIQTPDAHTILLDTGEADDAAEISQKLKNAGIKELDMLILSHYDKDHIGGAPEILEQFPTAQILMPAYEGSGVPYDALQAALQTAGQATIMRLTTDMSFSCGEVSIAVSVPRTLHYEKNQDNNASLVVTVTYGTQTMLFTGDAEKLRQEELLNSGVLAPVTFLKVPHHGVWNKKLDDFFAAVSPEYAVITCSQKNPAEEETITALEQLGTKIYCTVDGDIHITCTKDDMTITQ